MKNKNTTTAEKLISTDWLEENLTKADIRIFDCAVLAGPNPDPELGKTHPFAFESGRGSFEVGHIPGAAFIDILSDLSNKSSSLPLMVPAEKQFTEVVSGYGIGDDSHVVLYSSTEPMWAARVWWMLRAYGFNNASILDGGFVKWQDEKKTIVQGTSKYPPQTFTANPNLSLFAGKDDVLKATNDENTCIICALPAVMYRGTGGPMFGRKGRVASSVNVPTGMLNDPDTGAYLPSDKLRKAFVSVGADKAEKIITYCGGGIAASNDAFALALLGYENVAVYDASMFEWGNDNTLPMERD